MVGSATVWMVLLRRGDSAERKGTLTLEDDALVFIEEEGGRQERLAYGEVRRARRVKGSPILIVTVHGPSAGSETAFYFTQPPPLSPPEYGEEPFPGSMTGGRSMGPLAAMRRTSKRRHMRDNVRYLTAQSGNKKPEIQAWVDEITARCRG